MKDILGDGNVTLSKENSTVRGLLQELSRKHGERFNRQIFDPETGEVKFYRIVVNGRQVNEMDAPINNGDDIQLFPAMAGG
jgi:MoaD family protein